MGFNNSPGSESEFIAGLTGLCGETALDAAEASASGGHVSADNVLRIAKHLQALGQADSRGATTLSALAGQARTDGYTVLVEWDYSEPFNHDWHAALLQYAGAAGIVLQLAKGGTLTDSQDGSHDETGVTYHFVGIVNKQSTGYVTVDGDNPDANRGYQVYNYQTLINAVPCGMLIIAPKEGTPVSVPYTVSKNAANQDILTYHKGVLGAQFSRWVLDHSITADLVIADSYYDANAGFCSFDNGLILFWDGTQVHDNLGGYVAAALYQMLQTVKAAPATVQSAVPSDLHSAISDVLNATAPFAAAHTAFAAIAKELGY